MEPSRPRRRAAAATLSLLLFLAAAGPVAAQPQPAKPQPAAGAAAASGTDAPATLGPPPLDTGQLVAQAASSDALAVPEPDVPLSLVGPQDPQAFAASLPRCWWARQATLVGQSLVTYDCRVRAPGLDGNVASLLERPLTNGYIQ
ncbi:hypothetical protein MNEG_8311 [Monoraphidium neglectum]|uniref:Uncharacterized protein n=1 Tax=Monoraphidium neglectum TaxID=145388 RepID=A0A0D2JK96_9CHLO|nr:hypothetical protein MNEG_8311 [Monoraphidium neglectum]KIY99652.1 hypothetical protein MNEG_8311 [Monoraphidium neglectum]|eukprot:XP_013898672.1 hypothetical protein MNEG_8311 [Monoraphidium neglectum]